MAVRARDLMQMFTATNTVDGATVDYRDLWQRKNLLLVSVPQDDPTGSMYRESLVSRAADLRAHDTAFIFTTDAIAGVPSPGVVVADRWGEIGYVEAAPTAAELPGPDDLVDWLRYVQSQCPECQGETR
jgi:hypothetical protein